MKSNLSHLDKAIRVGAGLFLLATPILDLRTYPANLLGLVLIATGLASFCPVYAAVRAFLPKGEQGVATREAHAGARH